MELIIMYMHGNRDDFDGCLEFVCICRCRFSVQRRPHPVLRAWYTAVEQTAAINEVNESNVRLAQSVVRLTINVLSETVVVVGSIPPFATQLECFCYSFTTNATHRMRCATAATDRDESNGAIVATLRCIPIEQWPIENSRWTLHTVWDMHRLHLIQRNRMVPL